MSTHRGVAVVFTFIPTPEDKMARLKEILKTELFDIGGTPVAVSTIVTVILLLVATFVLSAIVRAAIRRRLSNRGLDEQHGIRIATKMLHYFIVIVGVTVALHTAGVRLTAVVAAGAVFAVGLGLAVQGIAQSLVSGIILLAERTIKPGDVIIIDDEFVKVVDMGIRATVVRTRNDADMIVPNTNLVSSTVENLTMQDSLYRLRVTVGVVYSADMALVRRTLEEIGNTTESRAKEREPAVLMTDFGSSSVDFELSVWTKDPWTHEAQRSKLREAIWWAFKEKEITIAFPQMDVHFDPPIVSSVERLASRAA